MNTFTIVKNEYLSQDIKAFYHTDYVGYNKPGNPDYLNDLKNTFNSFPDQKLKMAQTQLADILSIEIAEIIRILGIKDLTICVIPRAKKESYYSSRQLLFKDTVKKLANNLNCIDGTNYIIRIQDTKTTHLQRAKISILNDGPLPYKGITKATCQMSEEIVGKNILLIDDLYTKTVNIDEDCLQALIDKGAKSVYFYAVGKTIHRF